MRNYIILNNQSSNDINGLIIQELAPISKPQQRTQVETIDGRDGDIVTPLGYAAYNKKIKIGLYGDFDINEIIAYFATKGTAIFSNEPDKYYNYQIVDQIDYERLVRFRVATVTMHVQPFKYSATEGTLTIDASDTVSGEGSEIALDNTAESPFNVLRHKGNATQRTYSGKNLCSSVELQDAADIRFYFENLANRTFTISFTTNEALSSNSIYLRSVGMGVAWHNWGIVGTVTGDANSRVSCTITISEQVYSELQSAISDGGVPLLMLYKNGANFQAPNDAQIELGSTATDYEIFVGGTASPNSDYPQDIQVLTGDSTVKITGKNILPNTYTSQTVNAVVFTKNSDGSITANGTASGTAFYTVADNFVLDAGTYTLSSTEVCPSDAYLQLIKKISGSPVIADTNGLSKKSFTLTERTTTRLYFRIRNGATVNQTVYPQIEHGFVATPTYEPYIGQSYVIPFGDTYLAAIGDYADEPVKVGDTWYIRRKIGKVVLDGSETNWGLWGASTTNTLGARVSAITPAIKDSGSYGQGLLLSDYFTETTNNALYATDATGIATTSSNLYFRIAKASLSSSDLAGFKTWLSTHNTTVYYVLATPTDEEITDQDLIDALDDFYEQAHGYKGRTHITASAQGDNAPAILSVEVNQDNETTVTNAGNTTSRPIITIYGQGNIGMYINDVQVLDIALGDEQYITIDSVAMEAYKDTTENLKNRLVTGDYNKLALNAGANKIYFTGNVTKYEISKYSRWL